jgi:hypothetical protein
VVWLFHTGGEEINMTRLIGAVCVAVLVSVPASLSGAEGDKDNKDVQAVIDKGIKALGGEEKLKTVKGMTWKGKGKISFNDNENEFASQTTVQGLDRIHAQFEGEFMGNKVKGVTVLNGDKGWRKFGDMDMEMDKAAVANEKRSLYLQVVPATLVPLKGKGFTVKAAPDEKVGGKRAAVLKVTGPDGKDFTLYLDKESGLPVKQVAKVVGFMGDEFTQKTTFGGYKNFGGIKKATKVENKRNGMKFLAVEITDFKALDKVDPKTFAKPD